MVPQNFELLEAETPLFFSDLPTGYGVLLSFRDKTLVEDLWVCVDWFNKEGGIGRLVTRPLGFPGLDPGRPVLFSRQHVKDIARSKLAQSILG
jgi:hypothetical protein